MILLFLHLANDRAWSFALGLNRQRKSAFIKPSESKTEQPSLEKKNLLLTEPHNITPPDQPQPPSKLINYKKTYAEIEFNVHLMDIAT